MRRLLALFLSLFLTLPAFAAFDFYDLSASHANYTAIMYLREEGIINGYGDNTYRPDQEVNRAELMKIVVEGQGIATDPEVHKDCFFDVTDQWFAEYVCYAAEQGWVAGYEDGNFNPEQTVIKVEAAKIIVNIMGLDDELPEAVAMEDLPYEDLGEDQWYLPYLDVLVNRGVPEVEDGDYNPSEEMTRAKTAEYIFRVITVQEIEEIQEETQEAVEEVISFNDDTLEEFLEEEGQEELIPSDQLEITDVYYNGSGDNEADEYVEITNFGEATSLEGYTISGESATQSYTFEDVEIGAGDTIYVYTNQGDYSFESEEEVWSNGNDTVYLTTPEGEVMSSYTYTLPSI